MRLQLALNVRDLDEAIAYYGGLFNARPRKRRPGYANFAIDQPPLKLVLFENPDAAERLNHLGVEVFESEELGRQVERLAGAGLIDRPLDETTCCHATQTKAWSREPQGLNWEWYRVTDENPDNYPDGPETRPAGAPSADAGPAPAARKVCCA